VHNITRRPRRRSRRRSAHTPRILGGSREPPPAILPKTLLRCTLILVVSILLYIYKCMLNRSVNCESKSELQRFHVNKIKFIKYKTVSVLCEENKVHNIETSSTYKFTCETRKNNIHSLTTYCMNCFLHFFIFPPKVMWCSIDHLGPLFLASNFFPAYLSITLASIHTHTYGAHMLHHHGDSQHFTHSLTVVHAPTAHTLAHSTD